MSKKAAFAVMCGVLAAGIVCLIVGLIAYFTAHGNAVSIIIGLFAIATGGIMAGAAAVILVIILVIAAITNRKNKKDN